MGLWLSAHLEDINSQERFRHNQFAKLRSTREWYSVDESLRKHIEEVRAEHGNPFAAWNRWTKEQHAKNTLDTERI